MCCRLYVVAACDYICLYFLMTFKVFLHTLYGLEENLTFFMKCAAEVFVRVQFDGFLLLVIL
jgi:hypothetical protein